KSRSGVPSRATLWVTLIITLACAFGVLLLGSSRSDAEEAVPDDRAAFQTEAFATCAGRFSAVAARQLAQHDPASEQALRFEHDFDALVEAILPLAIANGIDPQRARQWRIAGWTEMAHLIRLRYSQKDRSRADRASRAMQQRLATCADMILPS
ncbi:MAG: hypothetical protein AAF686_05905, partial [Pseudomonadota bacterium]